MRNSRHRSKNSPTIINLLQRNLRVLRETLLRRVGKHEGLWFLRGRHRRVVILCVHCRRVGQSSDPQESVAAFFLNAASSRGGDQTTDYLPLSRIAPALGVAGGGWKLAEVVPLFDGVANVLRERHSAGVRGACLEISWSLDRGTERKQDLPVEHQGVSSIAGGEERRWKGQPRPAGCFNAGAFLRGECLSEDL